MFAHIILFLFIPQLAHADFPIETGFGHLVSQISTQSSVAVDDVKTHAEGSSMSGCIRYEDNNSYDGQCLEWRSYCRLTVKFPTTDVLGHSEEFTTDPSFFDLNMPENAYNYDCDELLKKWSQENSGKIINYTVNGNLYESYRWYWGEPNHQLEKKVCLKVKIIRDQIISHGHILYRKNRSSNALVNDKFCDSKII